MNSNFPPPPGFGQDPFAPPLPPSVSFTEAANAMRQFGVQADPSAGTPAEGLPAYVTLADGSRMSAEEMVRKGGAYADLYDMACRIRKGEGYGFLDAFTADSIATVLPFFGMFASVGGDISGARDVKSFYEKKLRGEVPTEEETVKASLYAAENMLRSDGSFGYMVGNITKQMPGFMIEMGLLGSGAGAVRTKMAETAIVGTDAVAAAKVAFNGAIKTGMRENAMGTLGKYIAASGKSNSAAMAELLSSKTAMADTVAEVAKNGRVLFDRGVNAVRGFDQTKWAPNLLEKSLEYQAEESVRTAAALLSGDTKLARYWAGLKDSVVRSAKSGLADVGSWGTDASTVLTSAETSWKRAALDGVTELTVGAAAKGAELFLPRLAVTKAIEAGTGAISRSELDLVQAAGERGDQDLMESAWWKGLVMDLMEYVSENTGRGFNSLGRAAGLKFAPGMMRPATKLAGARFTTGAEVVRDAAGKLEHVNYTGLVEQARHAEVGSRLGRWAEARWGRRAMDEKVVADKLTAVEWALKEKGIPVGDRAALQATLTARKPTAGLSEAVARELGNDVDGYASRAVRAAMDAKNRAGLENMKFDAYFKFWAADWTARMNYDPLSAWNAFQRAGYDGVFSEMLEERYSDVFGALFGLNAEQDQSLKARMKRAWEAKWPGMRQFLAELVGFSVPMLARAGAMRGIAALGGKNEFEKRMDYASLYRTANRFGLPVLQRTDGAYLKAYNEQVKRLVKMEAGFRDRVDDARAAAVEKEAASVRGQIAEARENADHERGRGDEKAAKGYESDAAELGKRLESLEAVAAQYAEQKAAREDGGAASHLDRISSDRVYRLGVQDEARTLELEAEAGRVADAISRAQDAKKAFYDSLTKGQLAEITVKNDRVSSLRTRAADAEERAKAARAGSDEVQAAAFDKLAKDLRDQADAEELSGGPLLATPVLSDDKLLQSRSQFSLQSVPTEAQAREQLSATEALQEGAADYAQGSYKMKHKTPEEDAGWFRRASRWVAESALRLGGFAATADFGFLSDNPLNWNARDRGMPGGLLDLLEDGYARAYESQLRYSATTGGDAGRGTADTESAHARALEMFRPEARRIVSEWLARKQVRMFSGAELRDFAIDSVARSHGLFIDPDSLMVRSMSDLKAPGQSVSDFAAAHAEEVDKAVRGEAATLYTALSRGEGADAVLFAPNDAAHAVQSVLSIPEDLPTAEQALLAQMADRLPSLRDVLLVKDVDGTRMAADLLAGPSTADSGLETIRLTVLPAGSQILSVADLETAISRADEVDSGLIARVAADLGYDRLFDGTQEGLERRNRAVVKHAILEELARDPDVAVFHKPVSDRSDESDRLGNVFGSFVAARKRPDGTWTARPAGSKSDVVAASVEEMANKLAAPEYGYRRALQKIVYGSIRDLRADDPVKMIKALNLGDEYIRLMRESGADEKELDPLLRVDPDTGRLYSVERAEELRAEEQRLDELYGRARGQAAEAYLLPGESSSDAAAMSRAAARMQDAKAAHNRRYSRRDDGSAVGYRAVADDLLARNGVSVPGRGSWEANVSPAFAGKYVFHARALQAIGASADIYVPVDHQNAQSYESAMLGIALSREFARHRGYAEGALSRFVADDLHAFDRAMVAVRDSLAESNPELSRKVEELRLNTVARPADGIRKLSPSTFTEFVSAFNLHRTEVDAKHLISELGPHAEALKAVAPAVRKLQEYVGWTGFVDRMLGGDGFEVDQLRSDAAPPTSGRGLARYWALFAPAGSGTLFNSVKDALPGNATWQDFARQAAGALHAAANPQAKVVNTSPGHVHSGLETGVGAETEFADVASDPLAPLRAVQDILRSGDASQDDVDAWLGTRASELAGDTIEADPELDAGPAEIVLDPTDDPLDLVFPAESPAPVAEDGAPAESGFAQGDTVGYTKAELSAVADTVAFLADVVGGASGVSGGKVSEGVLFEDLLSELSPSLREADRAALLDSYRDAGGVIVEGPEALWMDSEEDSDDEEGVLPDGFEGTNSRSVAMLRSQAMRQLNAIASVVSPHTGRDFLPFAEDVRNELGQFDRVFPADVRKELGEEKAGALDAALEYVRWIIEPQREDVEGGASEREALFHARVAMMDTVEGRRKVSAHIAALMAPTVPGSKVPAFSRAAVLLAHLMRLSADRRTRALRDQLASLIGEGAPSEPLRTGVEFTNPADKAEAPSAAWSIKEAGGRRGEVSAGFVTSSFARLRGLNQRELMAVRNRLVAEYRRMSAEGRFSSKVLWNRGGTGIMNAWAQLLAPVFGADSPLVAVMTARDMYVGLYNEHRRSPKANDLWSVLVSEFGLPKGSAVHSNAFKTLLAVIDSISYPEGGRIQLDDVTSAALDVITNGARHGNLRSVDSAVNSMHGSTEWMRLFQAYADARPRSVMTGDTDPERTSRPSTSVAVAMVGREPALTQFLDRKKGDNGAEDVIRKWFAKYVGEADEAVRKTLGEMRTRLVWPDPTRTRIVAKNLSKSVYANEVVEACRNSYRENTTPRADGTAPLSNRVYVPLFSGDHSSSILVQVPLAAEFAEKEMTWDEAAEMVAGWLGLDLLGVDPKRSSLTCFEAPAVAMSGVKVDEDGRQVLGDDGKPVRGHNYFGVVWNTAPGANNEAFIGSAFTYGYAAGRLHAMAKDPNATESKFHMMSVSDDPKYGPSFTFNKALYLTHAGKDQEGGQFPEGTPLRMLSDFAEGFISDPEMDSLTVTDADAVKIGLVNNKTLGPDNGEGKPGSLMTLILQKVSAHLAAGNKAPSGGFDAAAIDEIVGPVKWLDFTGRRDRESELKVSQVLDGAKVSVLGDTDGGQMLGLTWRQDNVMAFTAANVAHHSAPSEGPMPRNYVMDMLALNRTLETHSANVSDPGLVRLPENVADTVSAYALAGACLAQDPVAVANLLAADEEYVNAAKAARGLVEGGQIYNEFVRKNYSAWARKHLLSAPIEGVDAALNSNGSWIGEDGRAHSHSNEAWFNDLLQGPRAIVADRAFWGANKRHAICNVNCSAKGFRYGLYVDGEKLRKAFAPAERGSGSSMLDDGVWRQLQSQSAYVKAKTEAGDDETKFTALMLEAVINAIEDSKSTGTRNLLRKMLGQCLYDHHGTYLSDRKWKRRQRRRTKEKDESGVEREVSKVVEVEVTAALDVSFRDLFYRGPDGKLKFDRAAVHGGMHDSKGNVVPYLAGTMFGFPRTPSYNGSMWAQVVRAGIPVKEIALNGDGSQWIAGYDAAVAPDPFTLAILGCDHDGDKTKLYMLSSEYTEYPPDVLFNSLAAGLDAVASARTEKERADAARAYAEDLVRRGYARYAVEDGKPMGLEFTPSVRRAMSDWMVRTLFDMNRALPVPEGVAEGATVLAGEARDGSNSGAMFGATKYTPAPAAKKGQKNKRGTWDQPMAHAGPAVLDANDPKKLLKVPSVSAAVQVSAGQASQARAIIVGINRALHVAYASGLPVGPRYGLDGANAGKQFVDFLYHLDGFANMTFDDLKHQVCGRIGFFPYMVETVVSRMLVDGRPMTTDREFMDEFDRYVQEIREEGSLMSLLAKASNPADYKFRIEAYREITGEYPYIGPGRKPPTVGAKALGGYLGQDEEAPVTGSYSSTPEPKSGTILALLMDSVKTLPEDSRPAAWSAVFNAVAGSGTRVGSAGLGAALMLGRLSDNGRRSYSSMSNADRAKVDSVVKWARGLSFIQEAKRFRNLVDWAAADPLAAGSASDAARESESWNAMRGTDTPAFLNRMHAARQLFNGGVTGETAAMKGVRLAAKRADDVDGLVRDWGRAETADPAVAELLSALAAAKGISRFDVLGAERAMRSTQYAIAAFLTMPETDDGTSSLTKANAWDALYAAGRALAASRNADNPGANLTLNVRRFVEAAVETLARTITSDGQLHKLAPVFDFIRMVPDAGKYQYDPSRYGGAAVGLSRIVPMLGHVTEDQLDSVRAVVDRVLAGEFDGKGFGLSTESLKKLALSPDVQNAVGNYADGAREGRSTNVAADVALLQSAFAALDGVSEGFVLEPSAVFGQLLPLYAALTSTVDGPVGEGTHSILALYPDYVQAWEAKAKELSDGPARVLFDAVCAMDFSSSPLRKKAGPAPTAGEFAERLGTRGESAEGAASDLRKAAGGPSEMNPLVEKMKSQKALEGVPSRLSDPDFRGTVAAFDDVRGLLFARALQAFAGKIDISGFTSEVGLPAPAMSPVKAPAEAPSASPNGHDSARFKGEAGARETLSSERTILSSEELDRWNEKWNAEGKPGKPRILTASEHTDPAFHANQILKMLEGKEPVLEWSVRMGDGSPGAKIQSSLDARDHGETLNPVQQMNVRDFRFTPLEDAATWNDGTPLYRKSRKPVPVSEYREVNGVKGFYEAFLRPANTKPSDYQGLYLITKHDGLPMLKLLQTKIPKFIHFSVTTLGGSKFEPGVMHYQDLLARIEDYLKQGLDPKDVTIRIDPIVPDVTKLKDVENVIKWCKEHNIGRVRFSILDWYANSARALRENCGYDYAQHGYTWTTNAKGKRVMALRRDRVQAILDKMVEIADRYGVTLSTCAENLRGLKGADRVKEDGCLSVAEINRVLGTHIADLGKANSRQREECSCYGGKVDMLAYDAKCYSACMYCYARHTKENPLRYYNEDGTLKDNDLTRTREGEASSAPEASPAPVDTSADDEAAAQEELLGNLAEALRREGRSDEDAEVEAKYMRDCWNLLRRIEKAAGVKGFADADAYIKALMKHGLTLINDEYDIETGLEAERLLAKLEAEPETPDPLPSEEDKSYHPEVAAVADRMRAVMRMWDAGNVVYDGGTTFKIVGKFHRTGLVSGDAAFDTEITVSVEDRPSKDTPLTDAQVLTALAKTDSTMTLKEFRELPGATQAAYLAQWAGSGRYVAGFRHGANVAFSVTPEALGVVTGRISLYRGADGKFDPANNSMFHEFFHAAMSFVRAVGGMTAEDVKVLRGKYGDHPAMSGWFNEEKAADDFRRIVEGAEEVPEAMERGEKAEKGPKGVLSRILFMLRSLYDALFRFARGQSSSDYANEMEESPLLAVALTGRVRQSYPTGARRMDFDSRLDYAVTRYLSRLDQAYERINSSEVGDWQYDWLQKLRGTVNDPRNPLPVPRGPDGLMAGVDEELDEATAGTRANHVYPPGVGSWAGLQDVDKGAAREIVESWRGEERRRTVYRNRAGTRGIRGGNPYVGARYAGQTTGWTREELILNAIDPGEFPAGRTPAGAVESLVAVLDRLREIGMNPDAKERRRLVDALESEYMESDPFGARLIQGVGKFLSECGPSYRVDGVSELADAVADGTVSGNWTDDAAIAYDIASDLAEPAPAPDFGDETAMADVEPAVPKLREIAKDVRGLRMDRPYARPYVLASKIGAALASRFGDAASVEALERLTQTQRDAKLDEIGKVAETAARETLQLFGWKADDERVRNAVFSAMVELYSNVRPMVDRAAGGRVGEAGPHARRDQDTKRYASAYDLVAAVATSTGALPRDMAEAGLADLNAYYAKYKEGSAFRVNVLDRCAAALEAVASADPTKLVTDLGYLEDVVGSALSGLRAGIYDGPRGPNGEFGDYELAEPVDRTVNKDAIGDRMTGDPGNIARYADHIGNPDFHNVMRATLSKLYSVAASVKFYRQIGMQPGRPEDSLAIRALAPYAPEPLTAQDAMAALNVDPKRLDEPGYGAVDFYAQPWFMAQHPDAWLDSLVRPRFGMVDPRESQKAVRDACAGLQKRIRLARGQQDRLLAMDVVPGDAPTSFRVVEGPSFRQAGGVAVRDPDAGPRVKYDGYGGSKEGKPVTVNGARWTSLWTDALRVWVTGSRKLLTGVDGITFSVNDSADPSHYEIEKVRNRAKESGGIAGGYSDFDRALLRLVRQWHDGGDSGEDWDGVTGKSGMDMYDRLVQSACKALGRAKEFVRGGDLRAEDVNGFVISEMVRDGLVAAKYVKQDGQRTAREAVVCLDVDEIDRRFHMPDNEGYSVLLSAGRKPEWLTREAVARPMLELAAEVKRFVGAHPWLSDGDGAFFHDLSTPLMFVRGSGHFMYQANRRERARAESLTSARGAFEEAFGELMNRAPTSPVPSDSDAVPLLVRTLFHTDQKDAEAVRNAINRGDCAKYGIPAHASVGDVLEACYKKLLELEWAENGDPSLKEAGGYGTVSRLAAMYERRRRDEDAGGSAPIVSGGRGMTDEIMYNMTGCLPANHQLGYALQHMVDGLTNAIAFRCAAFNMMTAPDREGKPVCLMDPGENAVRDGGITDPMWGAAARWWDEQFKTGAYDPARTGVENAHAVYRAVKERHGKEKEWGHLDPKDIDVPSIEGVMARKTVPDGESSLDYAGGGYALGYAKHLFQSTRALGAGWQRELIHRAWAYSKALSVSFSYFFPLATRFESPTGAVGAIATLGGNFAPEFLRGASDSLKKLRGILKMDSGWITKDFVGQRDVFDMLDSDDPYLADLVQFAASVGLTLSDSSVNVLEQQRGIMQRDLENSVGWVRRTYGAKAARRYGSFMKAVFTRGGERAFTYHLNATKLAVAAQMVHMLRAEAARKGIAFDPVRDFRRYVPYVNAEIGGVDPLEYAWAHPGAQNLLSKLMFSWNWTRGAWEAGGGKVIEQVLFGGHAVSAEERNYYLGRWLRMGLWVVYGLPFVMQILCKFLAVCIDPDHDDVEGRVDPWFTWQNESRAWLTSFDMTPLLRAVGKRFPSYAEWAGRHPLLASAPLYAGMILSKKPLLAAGIATATPWKAPGDDGRRVYGHLGKQVHELHGWFDEPGRTFASKLSMPVQRLAEGILGRSLSFMDRELPWSDMGMVERWVGGGATTNLLKAFLPMSLAGLVDAEGGGRGLTAFFPVRKGLSQYAAVKQIERRLDLWASDDRRGYAAPKLPPRAEGKRGFTRFAVDSIPTVSRIVREAMRNGVPEKQAYHLVSQALTDLTRTRYKRLSELMPEKASDSYDVGAVSKTVRELSRLGRVYKDLVTSYEKRLQAQGRWPVASDAYHRNLKILRAARRDPYGTEPVAPVEPRKDY